MRLTQFSEYALRLLVFVAAHPERLVTVEEAATAYDISRTHLMKVANLLVRQDFLKGVRGRAGGLMLARAPAEISLGRLIRATEPAFATVECFGEAEGRSARWRSSSANSTVIP
jgi:Rrf2 family nitric oxide-sensitive transcriptional repressor